MKFFSTKWSFFFDEMNSTKWNSTKWIRRNEFDETLPTPFLFSKLDSSTKSVFCFDNNYVQKSIYILAFFIILILLHTLLISFIGFKECKLNASKLAFITQPKLVQGLTLVLQFDVKTLTFTTRFFFCT